MNVLFIHGNYPAQFHWLAQDLGQQGNHDVRFLTARAEAVHHALKGVQVESNGPLRPVICQSYAAANLHYGELMPSAAELAADKQAEMERKKKAVFSAMFETTRWTDYAMYENCLTAYNYMRKSAMPGTDDERVWDFFKRWCRMNVDFTNRAVENHAIIFRSLALVVRRLIDPNEADLATLPKDERDFAISALSQLVVTLENVSATRF